MHVLMVDDHAMFLQGMKNLLGVLAPGLRVDTSGEVAHAVQLAGLVPSTSCCSTGTSTMATASSRSGASATPAAWRAS